MDSSMLLSLYPLIFCHGSFSSICGIPELDLNQLTPMKAPISRKVVKDVGYRQVVDLYQEGKWRFLMFSGTFPVHLRVVQDRREKRVTFDLTEGGFMKKFSGSWTIQPIERPRVVDDRADSRTWHSRLQKKLQDEVRSRLLRRKRESLVTLEHAMQLSVTPPGPLARLVRGIATSVCCNIVKELQAEAKNVSDGSPTHPWFGHGLRVSTTRP
uniref:Coenzyme Q-binding protein COQ10 START domain-containing protein n=1 Tax=Compsopogon caeruleus TaxID=31354 RepID=A0A7S1XFP0_9RHOD|mmetsp:Transcript_4127/g.7932  ORF Transcript_4127/g.7932 Transcript_4127/m.7932 type:complete len:212 (+) Transcript_4127:74-709(+)